MRRSRHVARVPWPLSEDKRQRFGIDNEWCTPKVSAALRAKFGLDKATAAIAAEQ